ncbi:MAG: hypothetical protein ACFFFB_20310 [Candidatus Heimdallarchaeota archaeon]
MLFQLVEINSILFFILTLLLILGYLFLVITGAINLKREENLKAPLFLIIIGAVEIVYELLKWQLYNYLPFLMGYTMLSYRITYSIMRIVPYVISIITFGVLIIILAKRNKENFGKKLLLSGIFWIIYAATLLIINIYGLFPVTPTVIVIFINLSLIVIAFMVASRIFLLLYSIKMNEKNLLVASILFITASTVFIFYNIIDIFIAFFP